MNNVNVMTDSTDSGFSKPKIFINPPPIDARCECCGVHIDKLTPYGGKGDPLVGDFSGAKLVENYRSIGNHPQCSAGAS